MNRQQTERIKKENMEKLDSNAGYHKFNCIRISKGESYSHANAKFDKCWELVQLDHKFITEARSKDRKREFDVMYLNTGEVFEFETNPKVKKSGATTVVL